MIDTLPIPYRTGAMVGPDSVQSEARPAGSASWRHRLPSPERQAAIAEDLASALAELQPPPSGQIAGPAKRAITANEARPRTAQETPRHRITYVHQDVAEAPAIELPDARSDRPESEPAAARADGSRRTASHQALEVASAFERTDIVPFVCDRARLMRDMRRIWMGPAFKRSPHTLLLVSLRLARVPGANTPGAARLLSRTNKVLRQALADLGEVYVLAPYAAGLVLCDKNLVHTNRIAAAIQKAVDERSLANPTSPMIFAAGAAALHRDDDPAGVVCLAEHCLRTAEEAPASRVIAESDAEIRRAQRRRAY
ncbi:hypothetical protein [Acuticoccus mangrovi]|uniref:GGDEF domain-containing protein n=1 Tax=Acuticoccus mangrovi TaxID=2796142 RepID=A0A934IMT8_9HYPH|nr:hypothetical protein [Acuticoccus mangrovi]MBJ3774780.1 hypothetical protein [Acuticoccus mangrovi]